MSSLLEEKCSKSEYQKFMDQNEGDNFNKNINLEKLCTSKYFWAEPYLLKILPYLLDNISNYKMAETSDNSCHLILSALSKESVHLPLGVMTLFVSLTNFIAALMVFTSAASDGENICIAVVSS